MNKKLIILFVIFSFLIVSGFGCKIASKETKEAMNPVTLNYWRVWDGPDVFDEVIARYKEMHPFISINYRKLRYEEYEQELLEAWAEDRGPDILSVHNTWMRKYQSKLAPMPDTVTMAYPVVKGTIKKEVIPELRTTKSITLKELKEKFVDVVYDDVIMKYTDKNGNSVDKIFGLPLSVDTLAMYYNRDLLNNVGIIFPPEYWNREFQQAVKKMTKQNNKGQIIQSGVALGGGENVERSIDILSVLMMQNGAVMMNDAGTVMFNTVPTVFQEQGYNPGLGALRFYVDFADPAKEVYCWNSNFDNSLDMFIQGNLAMMFGYAYHFSTIKAGAPKLNFSVAPLPQIEDNQQNVNFANYWIEAVSGKSKNIDVAWDFVQFITKAEQASSYLSKVQKPTALRSLVESQLDDLDIGVFANQVLTSKSWYKGRDINATEAIIKEMIEDAVKGEEEIEATINKGARKVQQTIVD